MDCASYDFDQVKPTIAIATNVVPAVIMDPRTAAPLNFDGVNNAPQNFSITNICGLMSNATYAHYFLYDEEAHEAGSVYSLPTNCIQICVWTLQSTFQAMAGLVDTGVNPALFIHRFCLDGSTIIINCPTLLSYKQQKPVVHFDRIIHVFARIGDISIRVSFAVT